MGGAGGRRPPPPPLDALRTADDTFNRTIRSRNRREIAIGLLLAPIFLERHRAHLLRQAALLRRVPLWHIGPFLPGILLIEAGVFASVGPKMAASGQRGVLLENVAMQIAVIGGILGGISWLNLRAARKLSAEAEKLRVAR